MTEQPNTGGRPTLSPDEPTVSFEVTVPKSMKDWALATGNASAYIRRLIRRDMERRARRRNK